MAAMPAFMVSRDVIASTAEAAHLGYHKVLFSLAEAHNELAERLVVGLQHLQDHDDHAAALKHRVDTLENILGKHTSLEESFRRVRQGADARAEDLRQDLEALRVECRSYTEFKVCERVAAAEQQQKQAFIAAESVWNAKLDSAIEVTTKQADRSAVTIAALGSLADRRHEAAQKRAAAIETLDKLTRERLDRLEKDFGEARGMLEDLDKQLERKAESKSLSEPRLSALEASTEWLAANCERLTAEVRVIEDSTERLVGHVRGIEEHLSKTHSQTAKRLDETLKEHLDGTAELSALKAADEADERQRFSDRVRDRLSTLKRATRERRPASAPAMWKEGAGRKEDAGSFDFGQAAARAAKAGKASVGLTPPPFVATFPARTTMPSGIRSRR